VPFPGDPQALIATGFVTAGPWDFVGHAGSCAPRFHLNNRAVVAALLVYEHWLVRPDDLSRVNQAFFQVNGVVSPGLFAVVLLQLAVGA
jgi:hypothetical protein